MWSVSRLIAPLRSWVVTALALSLLWVPSAAALADEHDEILRFGLFAYRPSEVLIPQWMPLAQYLSDELVGYRVELMVLSQPELENALVQQRIDILFTNPAHYIVLRERNLFTGALATLIRRHGDATTSSIGGVIVVPAAGGEIERFEDLPGRRVAAFEEHLLGGFVAQAYELAERGVDLDSLELSFSGKGHDHVVDRVLCGDVEAGFIRTGILEQLRLEGREEVDRLRVLEQRDLPRYPFATSTRLYPEWPVVALPHVGRDVRRRLAVALLSLPANDEAARAAGIEGFDIPADYHQLAESMRVLRLPPFDDGAPPSWREVLREYRLSILFAVLALMTLSLLLVALMLVNRRLRAARGELATSERRWIMALEGAGHGVWDWDAASDRVFFSTRWKRMLGLSDSEVGDGLDERGSRIHPDDAPAAQEELSRHVKGETPFYRSIHRVRAKDGGWRWILDQGMVFTRDISGTPLRVVGTHTDLTQVRETEDALVLRRQLYAAFVAQASDGIVVIDPATYGFVEFNEAAHKTLGYEHDQFAGLTLFDIQAELSAEGVVTRMGEILLAGGMNFETRHRRRDGTSMTVYASNRVIHHGEGVYLAALWVDLSERERVEAAVRDSREQVERIAFYDPLTGLANRRLLIDRLRQAMAVADRLGTSVAVCYLDLDNFKPINDRSGHEVGDAVLLQVAKRLSGALGATDTVARWGGDEFALVLTGLGQPEQYLARLERIRATLGEPLVHGGQWFTLSASVGVALYPQMPGDADTLLRRADQAMYLAKQDGRDRMRLFDADRDMQSVSHARRLQRIAEAIDDDELRLYYQPVVDMRNGEVVGVEALLRWQHPQRGLLPPDELLRSLGESDIALRIDTWVMNTALSQLSDWQQQGLELTLHLNVAPHSLLCDGFIEALEQTLAKYPGVPSQRLSLESTESEALRDLEAAEPKIRRLADHGVRFALDEFGTGYSSLLYFRHLPADMLKIHKSFVAGMLTNQDDLRIVEAVIGLARAFDRQALAEGVESEAHGVMLLRLGCDLGQGFGIAPPMPAQEIAPWSQGYRPPADWQAASVCRFRVGDLPLLVMESEHRAWVERVEAIVAGNADLDPMPVDARACRFGRWYGGEGARRYGALEVFADLGRQHEEVHRHGRRLIERHRRGERIPAADISELHQARDQLIVLLFSMQIECDEHGICRGE